MPNVPNLGNLNVGSKSQSSNAQGGLAEQMGSGIQDELGRSRMLSSQLQSMGQAQPRSQLDVLTSPRGIATLIAGLGAIAAGGGARAAGIGALLGALQGAQQTQEGERAQKEAAIEQLSSQYDKSQARLDKARTRLAGLVNTNPDLFVDPETREGVDPDLLGALITGEDIPLHVTSRRVLAQRTENYKRTTALFESAIEKSESPEQTNLLVRRLVTHLAGDGQLPDQQTIDAISGAFIDGAGDESELFNMYLKHFNMSGRDAIIFAQTHDLSLKDPQVVSMLRTPAGTARKIMDDKVMDIMDKVIVWENAPENRDIILQIRAMGKPTRETQEAINLAYMTTVKGDDSITITEMNALNKYLGVNGFNDRQLQWLSVYKPARQKTGLARMQEGLVAEHRGVSADEDRASDRLTADQAVEDIDNHARLNSGRWLFTQMNKWEGDLSTGMKARGQTPTSTWLETERASILAHVYRKLDIDPSDTGQLDVKTKRQIEKLFAEEIQKTINSFK